MSGGLLYPITAFNEILPAFTSSAEGHLADGGQVVDDLAQHLQLLSDGGQLLRVRGQVVAITTPGFATARKQELRFKATLTDFLYDVTYGWLPDFHITSNINVKKGFRKLNLILRFKNDFPVC